MGILVKVGKSDLSYSTAVILFILIEEKNDRKYKRAFGFTRKYRVANSQETSTISCGKKIPPKNSKTMWRPDSRWGSRLAFCLIAAYSLAYSHSFLVDTFQKVR